MEIIVFCINSNQLSADGSVGRWVIQGESDRVLPERLPLASLLINPPFTQTFLC
jgi:hypothetical protein